jgi:ribosomal protein L40E
MSDAIVVKYCPVCNAQNPAVASFCSECDWDLLNVPAETRRDLVSATPEEAEAVTAHAETSQPEQPAQVAMFPTPRTEDDLPTRRAVSAASGACVLEVLENPALAFTIRPGQTVGRAAKADVVLTGVPNLEYISRAHARFLQRGEQWFVQYVAEGNFIKVDGEEYTGDDEVALYDGSIIVLSLTSFRIKIT